MISEQAWMAAEERAEEKQRAGLYAVTASYDVLSQKMHVTLRQGLTVSFEKDRSQVMAGAADGDLVDLKIEGFGRYILFPKLEDGFTVESMLLGQFGSKSWEQAWAEKHPGKIAA